MPVEYRIDFDLGLILAKATGRVFASDIAVARGEVLASAPRTFGALIDFSEAELELSAADVDEIARNFQRIAGKAAFVGTGRAAHLIAMYLELTRDQPEAGPGRVFATREEALAWLRQP